MKHLKKFNEELTPDTYRSAARKLLNYNKDKKSKDLLDWADKKEFGYYNMWFVDDGYLLKDYTYTKPTLIGMYYGNKRDSEDRPVYGENILKNKKSDKLANELVKNWKEGIDELAIIFEFGFKPTSVTKKETRSKYLNNPSGETERQEIG